MADWFDEQLASFDPAQIQQAAGQGGVTGGMYGGGVSGYGPGGGGTPISGAGTGVVGPQQPSGDPQALIAQWQSSHPASNPDIPGLVQFLNQHGIQATQATHAGGTQLSDDKIIMGGGMFDLGSSLGGPGASWFSNPQGDFTDPNAGGGGSNSNLYNPNDLTAGWTQPFTAPTAEEAMNSPGIQAALRLGQEAIERGAASKGTLLTGGTLKDLTSFANDLGSQAYGDVWSRAMAERQNAQNTFFTNQGNLFNRNFSLAQLGQGSANAGGNLITGAGNAQAAGQVGSGNAWTGALGNIASGAISAIANGQNKSSYGTQPYPGQMV